MIIGLGVCIIVFVVFVGVVVEYAGFWLLFIGFLFYVEDRMVGLGLDDGWWMVDVGVGVGVGEVEFYVYVVLYRKYVIGM